MGIRFTCPACNGKLHVKDFLAGKRGVCPKCQASIWIPEQDELAEEEPMAAVEHAVHQKRPAPPAAPVAVGENQGQAAPAKNGKLKTRDARDAGRRSAGRSESPAPRDTSEPAAPQSPAAAAPAATPAAPESRPKPPAPSTPAPTAAASPDAHPVAPGPSAAPRPADKRPATPQPPDHRPSPPTGESPASADPIGEAPHCLWHVRPNAGSQQYGPADAATMRQWVSEGRVPPDALVWRSDWTQWKRAGDVLSGMLSPSGPPNIGVAAIAAAPQMSPSVAGKAARAFDARRKKKTRWTVAVSLLTCVAIGLLVTLVIVLRKG